MAKRTIVVGDIHGCYDELVRLLDELQLQPHDSVVCVGDLIVKGPENRQVLNRFIADARFSSVIGNHDLAVLRRWRDEPVELKEQQSACLAELDAQQSRYQTYLASLPPIIDLGRYLVVHAGVRPGVELDKQTIEDLTELRTLGPDRASRTGTPWYERYDHGKPILFGHWPAREVRRGLRATGLDTGCVYGDRLTAFIVETGEQISVPAARAYSQ